jgi:tRNA dimethylallyltransferase
MKVECSGQWRGRHSAQSLVSTLRLYFLTEGTTGVGKSQLSIDLAKALNGQIINGDAMQIYRTADVLTNKVTEAEMCGIKHHLLDFLDPSETYDVYNFEKAAVEKVQTHQDWF